jgi:hypothetical protein
MNAEVKKAAWYALKLATVLPATRCIGPTALITVLKIATPMAPPSWRLALNSVDALPVDIEGMVEKAAACILTMTWEME